MVRAVSTLRTQVQQLEKAPAFELPAAVGEEFIMGQNVRLMERNAELEKENGQLTNRLQYIEDRLTRMESTVADRFTRMERTLSAIQSSMQQPYSTPAQPSASSSTSNRSNSHSSTSSSTSSSTHISTPRRPRPPLRPIMIDDETQGHGITQELLASCRINAENINVVARRLASALFTVEERMEGCMSGKKGRALDPAKVQVLREHLFSVCPVPRSHREKAWRRAVVAIDSQTRYMRLKKGRSR